VDGSGRNFLGRFLGGKASASSFAVTIVNLFVIVFSCPALGYSQEKPPVNIYTLIHMHVVNKYVFFHNEAQGGAWPQATVWPAARRARAPARLAAAGLAPVPSAGGSRRTGPAPLGASFIYALLSKNGVNRGFYVFVSL